MKDFVKEKKSILIVICVMFIVTISAFTINNFSHAQEEYSLLSTSTQNTIIKLVNNQGVNTENIDSIYFVDLTNKMYSDNATVATFKGTDGNLISAWTEDNALYIGGENTIYPGPELTGAFYGLTNLNIIDMGIANTSNVTGMASMFSDAGSNSQSFTLNLGNKFNTANVQKMNDMFSNTGYNSTIFTLDLGNNFNTSNVTDITHIDGANIYIAALIYDGTAQEPNVIINHNEKRFKRVLIIK